MIRLRYKNFRIKPWSSMTEDEKDDLLSWVIDLCRTFGCSRSLALIVAHEFAKGLES